MVKEWRHNSSGGLTFIGSVMREREVIVNWSPVEINENGSLQHYEIYPNPIKNDLIIKTGEEVNSAGSYSLIDLSGRSTELKPEKCSPNQLQFNLSVFESGLYLLRIENEGSVIYRKLIKE